MRSILMAGAAALSMTLGPMAATAQSDVPGSTNSINDKRTPYEMNAEQRALYDAWPQERRTEYDTWPSDYKVYYWTLTPAYQTGYWALTPEQRMQIYAMSEAQQAAAWSAIMAQMGGAEPLASAGTRAVPTTYTSTAMVQGDRAPVARDDYPVCKGAVQDSCINPRAAGMNWGNRPLEYWPGKPASETGG